MLSLLFANPLLFLIGAAGLVMSLSLHEFAHAWTADKLGDPTPRMQGRVSLNPMVHLDPLGTLALLVAGFGWGKPVQFDPFNLQHPLRDSAIIAAAGPISNLLICTVLAILFRTPLASFDLFVVLTTPLLIINLGLAIFNLIPVYPLDGSRVLTALLPRELAYEYEQIMQQYGFMILLLLVLPLVNGSSAASFIIRPIIEALATIFLPS